MFPSFVNKFFIVLFQTFSNSDLVFQDFFGINLQMNLYFTLSEDITSSPQSEASIVNQSSGGKNGSFALL